MIVTSGSFTVVGAGRSGVAAANLLAERGADTRLVDDADRPRPDGLHANIQFEAKTHSVRRRDIAVLSPGISEVSPVRQDVASEAIEVIGEIELFSRLCPVPILAVTGTDGKSTTTTMLGAICAEAGLPTVVGGNLGNPLTGELNAVADDGVVVAEISAFQLTTCIDFRPRVAVVTNISQDHLDYHGGYAPYQAAKRRIAARMGRGDTVIINDADPQIARWPEFESRNGRPRVLGFSLNGADARLRDGVLEVRGPDGVLAELMPRTALPLLGPHNILNALAAALAAAAFGIPLAASRRALEAYKPLEHRLETIATVGGIRWINDSKATNPNAATAGIRAIADDGAPLIALVGGSSKDADYSDFGAVLRAHATQIIAFGETGDALADAARSSDGEGPPIQRVATMADAIAAAEAIATDGDTVLLSPACASFDEFKGYDYRGRAFAAHVRSLQGD